MNLGPSYIQVCLSCYVLSQQLLTQAKPSEGTIPPVGKIYYGLYTCSLCGPQTMEWAVWSS